MSTFEHEAALDQNFEHVLIESARADALPSAGTDAAWEHFASALAGASAVAQAPGLSANAAADGGRLSARSLAIKWLLIGAIGGASLSAVLMAAKRERSTELAPPARAAAAPRAPHDEPKPPVKLIPPAPEARTAVAAARTPVTNAPARPHPEHRSLRPAGAETDTTRAATLAAEVALLDAALSANAVGAYDDGLRLIGDYHQRFPNGELAIDAEVVALDALASKREDARVVAEATGFLARYPNDPHAAHVRQLLRERSR